MKKTFFFLFAGMLLLGQSAYAALVWNGKSEQWAQGEGTEASPYLLEKPQHLAYLSQTVANGTDTYEGKFFLQTEDFDMNGSTGYLFTPIGIDDSHAFQGTYNGGDKTIKNITITYANNISFNALFGDIEGATIENAHINGISFSQTGVEYMASFVAYMENSILRNCSNESEMVTDARYTGGLVARAAAGSIIDNCENKGAIISTIDFTHSKGYYIGGICGYIEGTISNSKNSGVINHTYASGSSYNNYVGGIIGGGIVTATKSGNNGDITISNTGSSPLYLYTGGLCGTGSTNSSVSSYTQCYNSGKITVNSTYNGQVWVSGLAGTDTKASTFTQCFNTGELTADISATARLLGLAYNGTFVSSYAVCNLSNNGEKFGISYSGSIQHCYWAGVMSGTGNKYSIAVNSTSNTSCTNSYYPVGDYYSSYWGQALSESIMKGVSFPMSLNHSEDDLFVMDEENINRGYPILAWQLYGVSLFDINVTCDENMGSVNGSGTYKKNETATISASPKEGYVFLGWQDGNTDNPRTFEVTGSKDFTAKFVKMVYTINVNQDCTIEVK